jgi:Domain of unknown function (DUF4386)
VIDRRRTRLVTAALLIAVPVVFNLFFALLQAGFDYPDILRRPPDEVLRRFAAGGQGLIALWYGFALTPALFLPAAVLLRRALGRDEAAYLPLATPLAIAASLVQLLGLLRWPFLVPELARIYLDPATDAATRAATIAVFRASHQYLGVAVGEHLGYLFTAGWTAVIAAAMLGSPRFRPWWGWLGLVAAVGILAGLLEPAGIAAAGTMNALSYILWSLWLVGTGIALLRVRPEAAAPDTPARVPRAASVPN